MDSSSHSVDAVVQEVIKSAEHYTLSARESYGGNRTITRGFSIKTYLTIHTSKGGRQVLGIMIANEKWLTQKCLSLAVRTRLLVPRARVEPAGAAMLD